MKPELLALYANVHRIHCELVNTALDIEANIKQETSTHELADLGYVLREVLKLLQENAVQLRKVESLTAKLFTALWALDQNLPAVVETEWCSCSPDVKTHASEPKLEDDPERYRSIMSQLGLPSELVDTGLFRLSFMGLADKLTQLEKDGKRLPEGLDKVWKEHKLSIRSRRKLATVLAAARQENVYSEEQTNVDRLDENPF